MYKVVKLCHEFDVVRGKTVEYIAINLTSKVRCTSWETFESGHGSIHFLPFFQLFRLGGLRVLTLLDSVAFFVLASRPPLVPTAFTVQMGGRFGRFICPHVLV